MVPATASPSASPCPIRFSWRQQFAKATIEKFVEPAARLYKQDRKELCGPSRLGMYVRRWLVWSSVRSRGQLPQTTLRGYRLNSANVTGCTWHHVIVSDPREPDYEAPGDFSPVARLSRSISERDKYASDPNQLRNILLSHEFGHVYIKGLPRPLPQPRLSLFRRFRPGRSPRP